MSSKLILIALGLVLAFVLPFAHGNSNTIEVQLDDGSTMKLIRVGCYSDEDRPNRALRDLYHNHRNYIDWSQWPDMTHVISACASWAKRKNVNEKFGIQFYGECWADVEPSRFDVHGKADNCINGVGEHWSNFVYSMKNCSVEMNLVFLVDSSGSVNDTDFGKFQMFIKDLAEEFKDAISEGDTEVAAVLFSTIPKTKIEFDLDDYDHINDIKAAVDAFSHQHGGQTRTGEALTFTLEEVFKKAPRPSVKNVLVVLTDGKAQGNVTGPAQDVRDHGVEVFAIGVGPHSNEAQLKDIASDPDDKHVFHVTDYKLEDITGPILDGIC